LRLDDNAAIYHAFRSGNGVVPVFVFDKTILDPLPRNDRRVEFIHGSVALLKAELQSMGGDLLVRHGDAADEIVHLAQTIGVRSVYCNHDYEPDAIRRDEVVATKLQQAGIRFLTFKDQVILEKDEVLTATGGMFSVFTPYSKAWRKACDGFQLKAYPVRRYIHALQRRAPEPMPSLGEIGFEPTNLAALGIKPGSDGAADLFQDFLDRIDGYRDRRNFPGVKGVSYLSVHLRFGTISIRSLARTAMAHGGEGAETWVNELIWREFYHQILWHRPDVAGHAFKSNLDDLEFSKNEEHFRAWCEGRTGYPVVDAAMRQLNETGYMHNRLRMIAASFLVKDLLIDWRWGEAYFAEKLIDFDLAANNGGWQWAASTGCDAQPYFRIFNPVSQAQKFDAEGKFIRRYVPELAKLEADALFAPWLARPLDLASAGVRLGVTYPEPIVDHAVQREKALKLFKRVA
jgi:deoxyribodipyrimidine photo-lyase